MPCAIPPDMDMWCLSLPSLHPQEADTTEVEEVAVLLMCGGCIRCACIDSTAEQSFAHPYERRVGRGGEGVFTAVLEIWRGLIGWA